LQSQAPRQTPQVRTTGLTRTRAEGDTGETSESEAEPLEVHRKRSSEDPSAPPRTPVTDLRLKMHKKISLSILHATQTFHKVQLMQQDLVALNRPLK
jgi:hypothetical protein